MEDTPIENGPETLTQEAVKLMAEKLRERKVRAIACLLDEKEYFESKINKINERIKGIEDGTVNVNDDCDRGERRY